MVIICYCNLHKSHNKIMWYLASAFIIAFMPMFSIQTMAVRKIVLYHYYHFVHQIDIFLEGKVRGQRWHDCKSLDELDSRLVMCSSAILLLHLCMCTETDTQLCAAVVPLTSSRSLTASVFPQRAASCRAVPALVCLFMSMPAWISSLPGEAPGGTEERG